MSLFVRKGGFPVATHPSVADLLAQGAAAARSTRSALPDATSAQPIWLSAPKAALAVSLVVRGMKCSSDELARENAPWCPPAS